MTNPARRPSGKKVQLLVLSSPLEMHRVSELQALLRHGMAGVRFVSVSVLDQDRQITLTSRQRQVLRGIASGETVKEIARRLGIAQKTVETHRAAIMSRLGIWRIAGLVRYALQAGLLAPSWLSKHS